MLKNITWLGHSSFKLNLKQTIYIDPWKIDADEPADIILVSHGHYDHYSAEDIEKAATESTQIICSADVAKKHGKGAQPLKPGEDITIGDITIEALPAYNIDKDFHPKENNWLGFIITTGQGSIYYAGDTDVIPEFKDLADREIDVALLPVGGTYTMDSLQAVKAAETIGPKVAVPYHYGDIVGTTEDARIFTANYEGESLLLTPVH